MNQEMLLEKYPVCIHTIDKSATACQSVDDVIAYLKNKVEADPIATFIAVFDHYAHTSALPTGEINSAIKDGKNIIFCFGEKLPDSRMLALRPRSIGVAETDTRFVISFLEAPMPPMNAKMVAWVEGID